MPTTPRELDPMNDAAQWTATAADGVTPSALLSLRDERVVVGYGTDKVSGGLRAEAGAEGHLLRRTIVPADLTGLTEIRLSLWADRLAGRSPHPFFLEFKLGSAALPLADPANTWHRLLPVTSARSWETIRLSLDDLPPSLAGAVTSIQLRCLDTPFTAYVDDIVALRPRMLADADRALVTALGGITAGGQPVPVSVRAPGEQVPPAPALDVVQFDVRFAPHRTVDVRLPCDHTSTGSRERALGDAYEIDYAVTPVAATRTAQAELVEALLDRVSPQDELTAYGEALPVTLVWIPGPDRISGALTDVPVLCYRVGVRVPTKAGSPVREVRQLFVGADQKEAV